MMEGVQSHPAGQRLPAKLSPARRTAVGELQTLPAKLLHRGARRADAPKGGKENSQALLHLLVGIQNHPLLLVIDQPRRQEHFEFAPLRFAEHAPQEPRADHVQFGFAHRSLKAQ